MRVRICVSAVGLGLVAALAGCTGDAGADPAPAPAAAAPMASPPAYNDADVRFAETSTVYIRQARAVAALAAGRGGCAELSRFADGVEVAQAADIEELSRLLTAWGRQPPPDGGAPAPAEQERLAGLSGAALERELLAVLIRNHQEVIRVAATADAGVSGVARQVAGRLVASRTSAIAAMRQPLGCR